MNCGPLWKSGSVNVTIATKLRCNTKDVTLHQENVKYISSAARRKFQFKYSFPLSVKSVSGILGKCQQECIQGAKLSTNQLGFIRILLLAFLTREGKKVLR